MTAGYYHADFTAMDLLKVLSRLSQPGVNYLPYFLLCREMGVRAVDGMVKGRVLDLRWTELVKASPEDEAGWVNVGGTPRSRVTGRSVNATTEEGDIAALSEGGAALEDEEEEEEVVGPKLVPTTPIMRYAMREVVEEYEDVQSVSEYASLSDVDEY